jgi:hypothetical protein
MSHLIVARYTDGRMVKGTTADFEHGRRAFHVLPADPDADRVQVLVKELKAVFFVQRLQGDRYYDEDRSWDPATDGSKVEVTFRDGEVVRGFTVDSVEDQQGFFMDPVDRGSNNERLYVVYRAVEKVDFV